jgi:hypothetical protein
MRVRICALTRAQSPHMRSVFSSAISRQIRQVPFVFPLVSRLRFTLNIVVPLLQTSMVCAGRAVDSTTQRPARSSAESLKDASVATARHEKARSRNLNAVVSRRHESTGYVEAPHKSGQSGPPGASTRRRTLAERPATSVRGLRASVPWTAGIAAPLNPHHVGRWPNAQCLYLRFRFGDVLASG